MFSKDVMLRFLRTTLSMIVLFLLCPAVLGATLHGTTYNLELKALNNVIVEIDTTPLQRYVSKDGTYSFSLDPGSYTIRARYGLDNFTTLTSLDRIKIQKEGDYIFDLFLLPDLDEDKEILGNLEIESIGAVEQPFEVNYAGQVLTGVIIFAIVIVVYFFFKKLWQKQQRRVVGDVVESLKKVSVQKRQSTSVFKERKRIREEQENKKAGTKSAAQHEAVQESEPKEDTEKATEKTTESSKAASEHATKVTPDKEFTNLADLDGDLLAVMQFIKREGGRTTQKDLRREIPYSEAKISLMISELEHKKLVNRIKKGRGNIIILKGVCNTKPR